MRLRKAKNSYEQRETEDVFRCCLDRLLCDDDAEADKYDSWTAWHKKDRARNHIPKGLRNVDKTASWSKSAYHGWVYGYGLHLTTTHHGFPVMFDILPANVNERKVLDKQQHRLMKKSIRCLIADAGYRDKKRATDLAAARIMLITPDVCVEQVEAIFGPMNTMAVAFFEEAKASRKTAIEPVFDCTQQTLGNPRKA